MYRRNPARMVGFDVAPLKTTRLWGDSLMNPHFAIPPHKPPFRRLKSCEVSCGRALLWNVMPVARRALGALA